MIILLEPDVMLLPAAYPIAVLFDPVLRLSAFQPKAEFWIPSVLA